MKTCSSCGQSKPEKQYAKRAKNVGGLQAQCRACVNAQVRKRYKANPEKYRKRWRACRAKDPKYHRQRVLAFYYANREEQLLRMAAWRKNARQSAIARLGGRCACCGEYRPSMLDVDHTRNDGQIHRKQVRKNNFEIYKQAATDTTGRFQMLCSNCNQSKRRNGGICEHITEKREQA